MVARLAQRRADRPQQRVDFCETLGAGTEGFCGQCGQRAKGIETFNAETACQCTELPMAGLRMHAQFTHVAQHHPAAALQLGQHLKRRARGTRVRVVGVIDQPRAARQWLQLHASGH